MLVKCEEAMAGETASRARPEGLRGFDEDPDGLFSMYMLLIQTVVNLLGDVVLSLMGGMRVEHCQKHTSLEARGCFTFQFNISRWRKTGPNFRGMSRGLVRGPSVQTWGDKLDT